MRKYRNISTDESVRKRMNDLYSLVEAEKKQLIDKKTVRHYFKNVHFFLASMAINCKPWLILWWWWWVNGDRLWRW